MFEDNLELADPPTDAMGKIRPLVMSAHKWGGDGTRPLFRKIRAVLVKKPEVLSAFGGSADRAAGWVKARWYQLRGLPVPGNDEDGLSLSYVELTDDMEQSLIHDQGVTHELYFDQGDAVKEDDGMVWKASLRTGQWAVNPLGGGRPLRITKELLDEVLLAYQDGAWEHVTIPLTHEDRVEENTGFVRGLRIESDPDHPGEFVLMAGLDFTEPDVKAKALRGSIANVSVGIDLSGFRRTSDGKQYKAVLKHIALTNKPFINKLRPFGSSNQLAASQWDGSMLMASDAPTIEEIPTMSLTEDTRFSRFLAKMKAVFTDFENELQDTSDDERKPEVVGEDAKGSTDNSVEVDSSNKDEETPNESHITGGEPMAQENEGTEPATAPANEGAPAVMLSQDEVQRQIEAAVAEERRKREAMELQLSQVSRENHTRAVREQVQRLQGEGHAPAVLTVVEEILLADERKGAMLNLSQDGQESAVSATDITLKLLAAMPKTAPSGEVLNFSHMHTAPDSGATPSASEIAASEYEKLTS